MAATDVIDIDTAQRMLGVDGQVDGALLQTYVSSASALLDRLCGPVVAREVDAERHDGGGPTIRLCRPPVLVGLDNFAVTEYAGTVATGLEIEGAGTLPEAAVLLDTQFGVVRRRSSGADALFASGRQNVVVDYWAGRFADTASVDERFRHACFQLVAHMWSGEQAAGSAMFGGDQMWSPGPGFAVPNRVRELLADELLVPAVA